MGDKEKLIKSFKETQDYKDICYMIDHIPVQDILISCIEDLNYKTGLNILTSRIKNGLKHVTVGNRGEIRVQLTKCHNKCSVCAIVENFKK